MTMALEIAVGIWLGVNFLVATFGAYFAVQKRVEKYWVRRRLGFTRWQAL